MIAVYTDTNDYDYHFVYYIQILSMKTSIIK